MKTKMKMMKYGVLGGLAVAGTVAGLVACGSGISPEDVSIISISPETGVATGNFEITIKGHLFDPSALSVTIGGEDCPIVGTPSETEVVCTAPSATKGAKDVVVSNSGGSSATVEGGFTYLGTVVFSRDLQPLFDQPLTGTVRSLATSPTDSTDVYAGQTATANNASCVFCHSPVAPTADTANSTLVTEAPCSTFTADTSCGSRTSIPTPAGSYAAGSFIASDRGTSLTGGTVKFPKGKTVLSTQISFSTAPNPEDANYQFLCSAVKYTLEVDVGGTALSAPIDPTLSLIYAKLKGGVLQKGSTSAYVSIMPKVDNSRAITDARRNPIRFTDDQVASLVQWYNEGADCSE